MNGAETRAQGAAPENLRGRTLRQFVFSSAALTILVLASTAQSSARQNSAPGPIIPDRPGQTNPPNVVPPGFVQFESGFLRQTQSENGTRSTDYLYNSTVIRAGVLDNCELRMLVEYAGTHSDSGTRTSSVEGFHPLTVGTKLAVCTESGARPQSALDVEFTLPFTGKNEFRPSFVSPSMIFLMQNTLTGTLTLGYNLGVQWDGDRPNRTGVYSFALNAAATERLGFSVEWYGFSTEQERPEYRADISAAYLMANNLQADCSAGMGLNGTAPVRFVAFGLAWRIPS